MAGAGYKLFNVGDVLTAAQVNTYLQEQTVMSFADAAARTSALSAVLSEGMMSYLRDTNAVQVYNGSAWVAVGGSSPLTTKGDLYGFSTVDARVPIGTNNQVLTADSAQALGLKWAAVPSAAKSYSLISTTALSGSTLTVTGLSGYDNFMFMISAATVSNSSSTITMRINGDSTASQYIYGGASFVQPATYAKTYLGHISSTTATSIALGATSTVADDYFAVGMNLFGGNSTGGKAFESKFGLSIGTGSGSDNKIISGVYKGSAVVSSVSIIVSAGTFSSGNLIIWGAA